MRSAGSNKQRVCTRPPWTHMMGTRTWPPPDFTAESSIPWPLIGARASALSPLPPSTCWRPSFWLATSSRPELTDFQLALMVGLPAGSAVVPQLDDRQYFREEKRSPMRRLCPPSHGHPKPIVYPADCLLCAFYGTPPVNEPTGEIKPLVVLPWPVVDPTRHAWWW